MKQANTCSISPLSDEVFFLNEQALLNLTKPKPKPVLQTIKIQIKNKKLSSSLCLQRASSLLLHSETLKELQTAREYRVEYFDRSVCICKADSKMTKLTFIFE